jgi:hypothetical protein
MVVGCLETLESWYLVRRVGLVKTNVSVECVASIFGVQKSKNEEKR